MRAIIKAVLIVGCLLVSWPAAAGPLDDGQSAYNNGDYAKALRFWRPLAEDGDATAQHNLGVMYTNGQGVSQNFTEAMKWYRLAAMQGLARAQFNLGVLYTNGQGVVQNYTEAMKWYRLAAAQGLAIAQYNLGYLYASGYGAPKDNVLAHMWFDLAAAQGAADAAKGRAIIAARMTLAQIAEAQRMAREWKPTPPAAVPATALIDINRADKKTLMTLDGISGARSNAIIKGRPYRTKIELADRGIIPRAVYEKIKDKIFARQATAQPAKPATPPAATKK